MGLPIFVSPRKDNSTECIQGSQRSNVSQNGGEVRPRSSPQWSPSPGLAEALRRVERRDGPEPTSTRLPNQSFLQWLTERNRDQEEVRREIRRTLQEATETYHVEETPLGEVIHFPPLVGQDLEELRELLRFARAGVVVRQRQLFSALGTGPGSMGLVEELEAHRRYVLRIEERISLLREQLDEGNDITLDSFRPIPLSAGLEDLAAARADLESSRRAVSAMRHILTEVEGAPSALYLDVISTVSMDQASRLYFDWLRRRLLVIRDDQYLRDHPEATGNDSAPE